MDFWIEVCIISFSNFYYLVIGGFNPFEKYDRQNRIIFPNIRDENETQF